VLIADDNTVIGVDLGEVSQAINYDLVPDPQRMLARWLRLGAAGPRRRPPEAWTLIDRSQDSPPEQLALERMPYLAGGST
jgi:superfamily II DNA/RNA helicase